MMKRPWQVWLLFGMCVLGAAAALAVLTLQALEANRLRLTAQAEAELEQRVSLALWRMDTELALLVAGEIVRPPSAYRPTDWMTTAANVPDPLPDTLQQQVTVPLQQADQALAQQSPPRTIDPPPYVLLQFEARPDGSWHSPQHPAPVYPGLPNGPASTTRLDELASSVSLPVLLAKLPSEALPSAADVGRNWIAQNSAKSPTEFNELSNKLQFFAGNRDDQAKSPQSSKPFGKGDSTPKGKSADLEQRNLRYQAAAQRNLFTQQQVASEPFSGSAAPLSDEQVGVTRPIWIGERLILARRVGFNGETCVQGCWLDWSSLKTRLLAEATDLPPSADLLPVREAAPTDPARMLAGLPVRMVVGPAAVASSVPSTLGWSLGMAWGGVMLAALAAGALLAGVLALSERRAAFVSSVTHELRTPLTTFRMYSEMLARGMVPDAERRQEYLHTLQREAERLTLLVENVLAYARLERGRKPSAVDRVTVGELLDRIGPRLASRAAQANMECVLEVAADAEKCELMTDQIVVEQILFNLVDNAAKYAREATDRRIHLDANFDGRSITLSVRDHGPGIEQSRWSGPMRAFGKTAEQSAETAPGVGLGLALCRRLAQQLGGRLEIATNLNGGATVTLQLPKSATANGR